MRFKEQECHVTYRQNGEKENQDGKGLFDDLVGNDAIAEGHFSLPC